MMISTKMNAAMNQQIGSELKASNQYLNIASYFGTENLPELAGFFFRQSEEEREHALEFVHYLLDVGGSVAVPAISEPTTEIDSARTAAKMALDWEREVTEQINDLMNLAISESDHASQQFLRWFVDEQVEEVATMDELLSVIERAGDSLLLVEEYIVRKGDPHEGED
ncbi:MAG: ferritin [Anaerolineales bacterium]